MTNEVYWTRQQELADVYLADQAAELHQAKLQWFRDYENHYENDDDGHVMQQRAKELGISGSDWQAYHKRLAEAASQF